MESPFPPVGAAELEARLREEALEEIRRRLPESAVLAPSPEDEARIYSL